MRELDFTSDIKQAAFNLYQIADEIDRRAVVMSYIMTFVYINIEHNYNNHELLDALQGIGEQRDLVYIMAGTIADLAEKVFG